MRIIESDFDYQAKRILIEALEGRNLKNLDDVEKFQDEIWEDNFAKEIGRKFMDKLVEWNDEETFEEVMEELADMQKDDEE